MDSTVLDLGVDEYDTTFADLAMAYSERDAARALEVCNEFVRARSDRAQILGTLAALFGVELDHTYESVAVLRDHLCAAIHQNLGGRPVSFSQDLPRAWAAIALDLGLYWGEVERRYNPAVWWSFFEGTPQMWERCLPVLSGLPGVPEKLSAPIVFLSLNIIQKAAYGGVEIGRWRTERESEVGDGKASYVAMVCDTWLQDEAANPRQSARLLAGLPKPGPRLGGALDVPATRHDRSVEELYRGQQPSGIDARLFWVAADDLDSARAAIEAAPDGGGGPRYPQLAQALDELLTMWPPVLQSSEVLSPYEFVPVYEGGDVLPVDLSSAGPIDVAFAMDTIATRHNLILCYWNEDQYDAF